MIEIDSDGNEVHGQRAIIDGVRNSISPFYAKGEGDFGPGDLWQDESFWESDVTKVDIGVIQMTRGRVINLLSYAAEYDLQSEEIVSLEEALYFLRRLTDPDSYQVRLL